MCIRDRYKRSVLQKLLLYHIPIDVHECYLRFVKQESQLLLGCADRTVYTRKPASDFRSWKETDFPKWLQSHTRNGDAAMSNVKSTPGNSSHVGHGCRQQHCIQNCGQTASWLLLTGYRKLPWHYLTVPFPTPQYMLYEQAVDISYPRLDLGYDMVPWDSATAITIACQK